MTTFLLAVLAITALYFGIKDLAPKIHEMITDIWDGEFEADYRDKFVAK